jgi:hypothetical protein
MKILKDTYSVRRYEDLAFAVAHYGTSMHKQLWDFMVDAGLNRKQIFSKYMKVLRETSKVNHDILASVASKMADPSLNWLVFVIFLFKWTSNPLT